MLGLAAQQRSSARVRPACVLHACAAPTGCPRRLPAGRAVLSPSSPRTPCPLLHPQVTSYILDEQLWGFTVSFLKGALRADITGVQRDDLVQGRAQGCTGGRGCQAEPKRRHALSPGHACACVRPVPTAGRPPPAPALIPAADGDSVADVRVAYDGGVTMKHEWVGRGAGLLPRERGAGAAAAAPAPACAWGAFGGGMQLPAGRATLPSSSPPRPCLTLRAPVPSILPATHRRLPCAGGQRGGGGGQESGGPEGALDSHTAGGWVAGGWLRC